MNLCKWKQKNIKSRCQFVNVAKCSESAGGGDGLIEVLLVMSAVYKEKYCETENSEKQYQRTLLHKYFQDSSKEHQESDTGAVLFCFEQNRAQPQKRNTSAAYYLLNINASI